MSKTRDHGGGLDAAVTAFGGVRSDWLDLSTGINPVPYPVGEIGSDAWSALPDSGAMDRLLAAARAFWNVPDEAQIVAANGASAIIAKVPYLLNNIGGFYIPGPTYNEHAAAVKTARGNAWPSDDPDDAVAHVYVHPNNPDGRVWDASHMGGRPLTVIDESFCDVTPEQSHVGLAADEGIMILKSFGKFWGLAGLRLGFAIGAPDTVCPVHTYEFMGKVERDPIATLQNHLGPWSVAGPALEIGARALEDVAWAAATRERLARDAQRLDELVGWDFVGGTDLFRTYAVPDAAAMQERLACGRVWSRVFPYSKTWIRLGLPAPDRWDQLKAALG